jgi:hypothetical protein
MFAVYALLDPRACDLRYIGMTQDVGARVKKHVRNCTHFDTPRDQWIRELRGAGLQPDCMVLEEFENRDACDAGERYWISRASSRGLGILNRTAGGQRGELSDESRERIGAKNRGRVPSAEARAKMSASAKARTGRVVSAETRAKISESNKGKGHSLEWRAAQAALMAGRKASPATKAKMSSSQRGNQNARRSPTERKSAPNINFGD